MSSLIARRATASLAAVLGAFLLFPSAGSAATNFGSRLIQDPANSGECLLLGGCTLVSFIHPTDPLGDPYSGGAPVSGVITRLRIRAYGSGGPAQASFRVGNVTPAGGFDSATAAAGAVGASTSVPAGPAGTTPITEVAARIPVTAGQHLAVDGSANLHATYNSGGSEFSYVYAPPLVAGQAARGSNAVTGELLVAATIEPDADKDGFGDETQDKCPSDGSTPGTCVTGLKVSGRTLSYSLTSAATVKVTLAKGSKGRTVNKKCVRQTKKNRKKKRCTRYTKIGNTISGSGKIGENKVTLPKLKRGKYQLTLVATDTAGNTTTKVKAFTVKKSKKKK